MAYTWNRRTPGSFPGPSKPTYDEKCYDLAAAFLEDEPYLLTERNNVDLAAVIQSAIEEWLTNARDNYDGGQP
jgi:hypothetical protein